MIDDVFKVMGLKVKVTQHFLKMHFFVFRVMNVLHSFSITVAIIFSLSYFQQFSCCFIRCVRFLSAY